MHKKQLFANRNTRYSEWDSGCSSGETPCVLSSLARLPLSVVCCCRGLLTAQPPESPEYELVLQAPPATSVDSVAVSPDGSLVATAAGEGGVRLYDAKTGTLLRTIGDAGDRGVRFSPDGRTLTAAGFHMDKLVGVFDVKRESEC